MALQAEIIHFTLRTGAGTQVIPHVLNPTLTAKAIIFTSASVMENAQPYFSYGFDDGTHHLGTSVGMGNNFNVSCSSRQFDSQYSLSAVSTSAFFGGAVLRVQGYVSLLSVGSFTVTITQNLLPGSPWTATSASPAR